MSKNKRKSSFSRSQKEIVIVGIATFLAIILVLTILVLTFTSTKIRLNSDGKEIRTLRMPKQFDGVGDPIKEGYTFGGWYYNAEGTGDEVKNIPRLSNKTLDVYAKWTPNRYKITFAKAGGTGGTDEITAVFDLEVPLIEIPVKDKYRFSGYFSEEGGAGKQYYCPDGNPCKNENGEDALWDIAKDTTLYANWVRNDDTFLVKFIDFDNSVLSMETVRYGDAAIAPITARVGYDNAGWDREFSDVRHHMNVKALYTPKTYKVSLDGNGGIIDGIYSRKDKNCTFDQIVGELSDPVREGFVFAGWELVENDSFIKIEQETIFRWANDIVFTAKWVKGEFDVYLIAQGTAVPSQKVQATFKSSMPGVTATGTPLVAPQKAGYTFEGYFDANGIKYYAADLSSARTWLTPENGIQLFAKFKTIPYQIRYKSEEDDAPDIDRVGGWTNDVENPSFYDIEDEDITLKAPVRVGYTFAGWKNPNGDVIEKIAKGCTGDKVFTATWNVIPYGITYVLAVGGIGDVTGNTNPNGYNIETEDITLTAPTRAGYTFGGWRNDEGNVVTKIARGSTENRRFTATWNTITYNISYVLQVGGVGNGTNNVANPKTYTVETPNIVLQDPTRVGYTFASWTNALGNLDKTIPQGSTEDRTFTATWNVIPYEITYVLAVGGIGEVTNNTNPDGYNIETEDITLTAPTRAGYTFGGWKNNEGTVVTKIVKGSTENRRLTATWNTITYNISYVLQVGGVGNGTNNVANPKTYTVETQNIVLQDPTRVGYNFEGWTNALGNLDKTIPQGSTEDRTFTATWSLENYNITYKLSVGGYGAGVNHPDNKGNYNIESAEINLKAPTRPGYTFSYWTPSNGIISSGSTGDKEFTAIWNAINYDIEYNLPIEATNNSNNPAQYNIERTITLQEPTRPGYIFKEWTGVDSVTINPGTNKKEYKINPNNDQIVKKTVTAVFDQAQYTITYEGLQSGVQYEPICDNSMNPGGYTYDDDARVIAAPTKRGYTFLGWKTAEDQTLKQTRTIPKNSTGHKTFTAEFSLNEYTVEYRLDLTGVGVATNHPDNKTEYTVLDEYTVYQPTRPGYNFSKWTEFTGTKIVRGSIGHLVLTAEWFAIPYGITYELNGGTNSEENPATYNIEATQDIILKNPTKTGYTFTGWRDEGTSLATRITKGTYGLRTFTATWRANKVTLIYHGNGNTCTCDETTQEVTYDQNFVFANNMFKKTGYSFANWNRAANGSGLSYAAGSTSKNISDGDNIQIDIYAQWSKNQYQVSFDANNGTGGPMANQDFIYDEAKALSSNVFTRTGYEFLGWHTSATATQKEYSEGQSVSNLASESGAVVPLFAIWKANTYYVEYVKNPKGGGTVSGTMVNSTHTYADNNSKLTDNDYDLTGYNFDGWTTNSDGTGTFYNDGANVIPYLTTANNVTVKLYAKWTPITYTLAYNSNKPNNASTDIEGAAMQSETKTYDVAFDIKASTYTLPGYKFIGWNTLSNGNGNSYTAANFANVKNLSSTEPSTVTLYAQWEKNQYTVSYDANKPTNSSAAGVGNTVSNTTHYYDTSGESLAVNTYTLTGWTFTGWNTLKNPTTENPGRSFVSGFTSVNITDLNLTQGTSTILYAQWRQNTYKIQFIAHPTSGVNGSMQEESRKYDDPKITLLANGYSRAGYDFLGWSTTAQLAEDSTIAYDDEQAVNNLTSEDGATAIVKLYTAWVAVGGYVIEYVLGGGANGENGNKSTYVAATDLPMTINPATRAGYEQATWLVEMLDPSVNETYTTENATFQIPQTYNSKPVVGTIRLTANWTANTYEVSFNANNGTGGPMGNQDFTYDIPNYLSSNLFTRNGYEFLGWHTSSGATTALYEEGDSVKNLTSNNNVTVPLYAIWKANSYEIVFNANGGTGGPMSNQQMTYDAAAVSLSANEFNKNAYTFNRWNTLQNPTEGTPGISYTNGQAVSNLAYSGQVTLYAIWTPVQYEIEYILGQNASNGAGNPSIYTVETPTITLSDASRSGYVFTGWTYEGQGTPKKNPEITIGSYGKKTFTANWSPNAYDIRFHSNKPAGTLSSPSGSMDNQPMIYGVDEALTAVGFTLPGFSFDGWYATSECTGTRYADKATVKNLVPSGFADLYAKWNKITYNISYKFKYNDTYFPDTAVTNPAANLATYNYDTETITFVAPTKTGYTFVSWDISSIPQQSTGDKTITASFTPIVNQVIFNKNQPTNTASIEVSNSVEGTTASVDVTYDTSKALTANGYSLKGWHFLGWAHKGDKTTVRFADSAVITQMPQEYAEVGGVIVNLYAVWAQNTFTVHFNKDNYTENSMDPQVFKYDNIAQPLTANALTRTGYEFYRWNRAADGSGTAYQNGEAIRNLSFEPDAQIQLYVRWQPLTYTVTLDHQGGLVGGSGANTTITATYDANMPSSVTEPTKNHYNFAGYFSQINGQGTQYYNADMGSVNTWKTASAATLYAKWTPVDYSITYDLKSADANNNATNPSVYHYNSEDITILKPTRQYYRFTGWYVDGDTTTLVEQPTIPKNSSGAKTYSANWTPIEYVVQYNSNRPTTPTYPINATASPGGNTANVTVPYFQEFEASTCGYSLTGWKFKYWTLAKNNANADPADQIIPGATLSNLRSQDGQTIVFYAQWELENYTIQYTWNDGTPNANTPYTYTYEALVNIPAPTKAHYDFAGWYIDDGTTLLPGTIAKNTTGTKKFDAQWTPKKYSVTFSAPKPTRAAVAPAGSMAVGEATYGVQYQLPAVGYNLAGWGFLYYALTQTGEVDPADQLSPGDTVSITENTKYYLRWEEFSYKIHFNGNRPAKAYNDVVIANGGHPTVTTPYETKITLPKVSPNFSLIGWRSTVWNTNSAGTGTSYNQSTQSLFVPTYDGEEFTLYVRWTENKYNIDFYPNADTGTFTGTMARQSPNYEDATTLRNNTFNRYGYTFNGWNTLQNPTLENPGTPYTNAHNIQRFSATNGSITNLYAQWTPKTYTISIDPKGGIFSDTSDVVGGKKSRTIVYGTALPLDLGSISKFGYHLEGLYSVDASTGGLKFYNLVQDPNTTEYYLDVVLNGAKIYSLTATQLNVQKPDDIDNLYARWTPIQYTIAYVYNGGNLPAGQTNPSSYTIENTGVAINDPVRNGYSFTGWHINGGTTPYKNYTIPAGETGNYTFNAQFEEYSYYVQFNRNKPENAPTAVASSIPGDANMPNQSFTFSESKALSTNAYSLAGYDFDGWATTSTGARVYENGQTVFSLANENGKIFDLYARWMPIRYAITYDTQGGVFSGTAPDGYYTHTSVSLVNPTRNGYNFIKWYLDGDAGQSQVTSVVAGSTGAKKYIAVWEKSTFTVTLDAQGGTGGKHINVTYEAEMPLGHAAPIRTGYTFGGYYQFPNGQGVQYYSVTMTSVNNWDQAQHASIYAKWTANSYKVIFNKNKPAAAKTEVSGADVEQPFTYDVQKALTANSYTLTGWSFLGWATSETGGVVYANNAPVENLASDNNAEYNLYAKWAINTYYVKFDSNKPTIASGVPTSVSGMPNQTFIYDVEQNLTKNDFTLLGWTFKGWNSQANGQGTPYIDEYPAENLTSVQGRTITMYAQWEANEYTVTIHHDNNLNASYNPTLLSQEITVRYDHLVPVALKPEVEGFTLVGIFKKNGSDYTHIQYYSGSMGRLLKWKETELFNIYAKWSENTYTIRYNSNKPSAATNAIQGNMSEKSGVKYTDQVDLDTISGKFTLYGWHITDLNTNTWNLRADGKGTAYGNQHQVEKLTGANGGIVNLYAQWSPDESTLSLVNGAGADPVSAELIAKYDHDMPQATKPTKTGYEFRGYFSEANGEGDKFYDENLRSLVLWNKTAGNNTTLYAYWTIYTYELNKTTKQAKITGFIDNPAIDANDVITIPSRIEGCDVVSIEAVAFDQSQTPELANADEIVIPTSVTSIGQEAFATTDADITFDTGSSIDTITKYSFSKYAGTTFTVPDSVVTIENSGFEGCTSLTSVEIPNTVTTIGLDAFKGCTSLVEVTLPLASPYSATSPSYLSYFFGGRSYYTGEKIPASLKTVNIAEGTTAIPANAFVGCQTLDTINLPSTIENIAPGAFNGVTATINFAPTSNLTTIPQGAFNGYKGTTINFPSSVTTIESEAFKGCTNLTAINLPKDVTNIGANAFNGVTSQISFAANATITTLTSNSFSGYAGPNIAFPDSLTTIQANAFNKATAITAINTNKVQTIGTGAFANCPELQTVTIGEALESLDIGSFVNCPKLKSFDVDVNNPIYSSDDDVLYNKLQTVLHKCPESKIFSVLPFEVPGSVTVIGENAFTKCTNMTSVDLSNAIGLETIGKSAFKGTPINAITLPTSVTSIGDSAFESCGELTTVHIPQNVETIGPGAFAACNKLTAITVDGDNENYASFDGVLYNKAKTILVQYPAGKVGSPYTVASECLQISNKAFQGATKVTAVVLPTGLQSIGSNAFDGCSTLSTINIPPTVQLIGAEAFAGCAALDEIEIASSVTTLGARAFKNCTSLEAVTIPAALLALGDNLFEGCTALKTITVVEGNAGYKSVNGVLFTNDMKKLIKYPEAKAGESYTIPAGVEEIADNAFNNVKNLTSITIPASLKTIGANAFVGCSNLSAVIFDGTSGLTTIKDKAFSGCGTLASITLPNSLQNIGAEAFRNCTGLTSIAFGSGLKSIGNSAFQGATQINQVTFAANSTLTSIGSSAFASCTNITEITLPNGLQTIGTKAFSSTGLAEITIPSSVATIGERAFENCTLLKDINMTSNSPCGLGTAAFAGMTNFEIWVNRVALKSYKGAKGWADYSISICPRTVLITFTIGEPELEPSEYEIAYKTAIAMPEVDARVGYTFTGWYKDASCVLPFETAKLHTEDTTIYGNFEANTYNLILDAQGGGANENTSVKYDGALPVISPKTKPGFVFKGYFDQENGQGKKYYGADFKPAKVLGVAVKWDKASDTTLYAFWSMYDYDIVGETIEIKAIAQGATIPLILVIPEIIEGKTVVKIRSAVFNSDLISDCANITSITIPKTIKEIGDLAFNKCLAVTTLTFADIAESQLTTIGKGAFANLRNITEVTIPTTVTTIGENAFNFNSKLAKMTFNSAAPPSIGAAGMYTTINPSILIFVDAESVTTYKQGNWERYQDIIRPKTITVQFNTGGVAAIDSQVIPYGQKATEPSIATKVGYSFGGWFTDVACENAFSFDTNLVHDVVEGVSITLYAKWTANTYTIKFDKYAGAATGTMENMTCTYGTSAYLIANKFTNEGYSFGGWATSPGGAFAYSNVDSVINLTSVANETVTLYAIWTANTYTIKFEKNAEAAQGTMDNMPCTYGTSKNLTENQFTNEGYTFAGWATSAGGTLAYSDTDPVINLTSVNGATITLYAIWTEV